MAFAISGEWNSMRVLAASLAILFLSCLLPACGKLESSGDCRLNLRVEDKNVAYSGVKTAVVNKKISQSVVLSNALTVSRIMVKSNIPTGLPVKVWIGYGGPDLADDGGGTIVSFSITGKAEWGTGTPTENWIDLPEPKLFDPEQGQIYITMQPQSLGFLDWDYGTIGANRFLRGVFTQEPGGGGNWTQPTSQAGTSIGLEGTTTNCDAVQEGE